MRITIICLVLIAMVIGIGIKITTYKSAFEADQACHLDKTQKSLDGNAYGCDHDLETRQWLLFQGSKDDSLAKVVSRYRY